MKHHRTQENNTHGPNSRTLERRDGDGMWHATMDTRLTAFSDAHPTHLAFLHLLDGVLMALQAMPVPRLPMPGWAEGITPWSLSHVPSAVSGPGNRSYLGQTRLWGVGAGFHLPARIVDHDRWDGLLVMAEHSARMENLPPCWRTHPHALSAHGRLDAVRAATRLAPPSDHTLRLLVAQSPTSWGDMAKRMVYDDEDTR